MDVQVVPSRAELSSVAAAPSEALADAAAGWDFRYLQLERGENRGYVTQLRLGGVDLGIDHLDRLVRAEGTSPHGGVTFVLPASAGRAPTWRGRRIKPDELVFQAPDEELDVVPRLRRDPSSPRTTSRRGAPS